MYYTIHFIRKTIVLNKNFLFFPRASGVSHSSQSVGFPSCIVITFFFLMSKNIHTSNKLVDHFCPQLQDKPCGYMTLNQCFHYSLSIYMSLFPLHLTTKWLPARARFVLITVQLCFCKQELNC